MFKPILWHLEFQGNLETITDSINFKIQREYRCFSSSNTIPLSLLGRSCSSGCHLWLKRSKSCAAGPRIRGQEPSSLWLSELTASQTLCRAFSRSLEDTDSLSSNHFYISCQQDPTFLPNLVNKCLAFVMKHAPPPFFLMELPVPI